MTKLKKKSRLTLFFLLIQLVTVASLLPIIYMTIANSIWRYYGQSVSTLMIVPIFFIVIILFVMVKSIQSERPVPELLQNKTLNLALYMSYLSMCLAITGLIVISIFNTIQNTLK